MAPARCGCPKRLLRLLLLLKLLQLALRFCLLHVLLVCRNRDSRQDAYPDEENETADDYPCDGIGLLCRRRPEAIASLGARCEDEIEAQEQTDEGDDNQERQPAVLIEVMQAATRINDG